MSKGYSPAAALAMARTMQHIAAKYDDPDLGEEGKALEKLAQSKIDEAKRAQKLEREAQDKINEQKAVQLDVPL